MKIQILDKTKKKKLISGLEEFGINKIQELLIRTGKERIRAYSGNLSKEEIMDLWRILPIEGIGLYIAKEIIDKDGKKEIRLSIDGLHLLKDQIKNNIITLNEKQEKEWFKSNKIDFERQSKLKGFVAVKSSDEKDFIGFGKISQDQKNLFGFLPKERRRKTMVL